MILKYKAKDHSHNNQSINSETYLNTNRINFSETLKKDLLKIKAIHNHNKISNKMQLKNLNKKLINN